MGSLKERIELCMANNISYLRMPELGLAKKFGVSEQTIRDIKIRIHNNKLLTSKSNKMS